MLRKTLIVLGGAIGISAIVMAPILASADGNGTGPGWGNSYIHGSYGYGVNGQADTGQARRSGNFRSPSPFPVTTTTEYVGPYDSAKRLDFADRLDAALRTLEGAATLLHSQ
jgi:hypothetical protein